MSSHEVFVCYAVTECYRLWPYNWQKFLGSGGYKSKIEHGQIPSMVRFWWEPSSGLQMIVFPFYYHVAERRWERALSLWPNHFPKAPPPDAITLVLALQHMNLGGTQTFRALPSPRQDLSLQVRESASLKPRNAGSGQILTLSHFTTTISTCCLLSVCSIGIVKVSHPLAQSFLQFCHSASSKIKVGL